MIMDDKKSFSIDKEKAKIVFMGTPEFARGSLEALVKNGYNVVATFCQPDKPKGRGMKFTKPPVKEYAEENNIPVYQPNKLRDNKEIILKLREINPDFIIVVAYGKILPKEILDLPEYGCINVHGSLLPKYRGAAPIQWALINGETETGITTMFMNEGMDTGDMLLKEKIFTNENETYETLYNKLEIVGASVLINTLDMLCEDYKSIQRTKQEGDFTIAPLITKEISKIDFNKNTLDICNLVRGLYPSPASYMIHQDERIFKVFSVTGLTNTEYVIKYDQIITNKIIPGNVMIADSKRGLVVATLNGFIELNEIQEQNSKRMNAKEYLKGKKIEVNSMFI